MSTPTTASLLDHFATMPDPRVEYLCEHKLLDIITIAICGVICGADDWVEIAAYGQSKAAWLGTFLELPHGIPSHDTFRRVFAMLDGGQFRQCFIQWVSAIQRRITGEVVAIDGKTLRRSHDQTAGLGTLHVVSAWATDNALVLGQIKVDDKSNEITAIPSLLRLLYLQGCIVTLDAMGCQKLIAAAIRAQGADYVLAVKENQPHLYAKLLELFQDLEDRHGAHTHYDGVEQVEKNHGRIETRRYWAVDDPDHLLYLQNENWPDLHSVAKVETLRQVGDAASREVRYYISSLPGEARRVAHAIRAHWGIENSLHWVLDIAFREDEKRLRSREGAELFAILRHIALNLLKQEASAKIGVHGKRLKAAWDDQYLLKVLTV